MADRFLIAPLDGGLQNNVAPWLIPDNAFYSMRNSYVFNSKVRKRAGSRLMRGSSTPSTGFESNNSRLRIKIATTNGSGNVPPGTPVPGTSQGAGVMFSFGNNILTCTASGSPATLIFKGSTTPAYSYDSVAKTINIINALANTDVYFYPSTPITGIATYENKKINQEETVAFDTQFAYHFTTAGWDRLGTAIFTGGNSDLFWTENHRTQLTQTTGLFVSNYNTAATLTGSDRMQVWNGTTWANFSPSFDMNAPAGESFVLSAKCIISFANRLLLFNIVENTGTAPGTNVTYVNRCRISWNGDPLATSAGGKAQAYDTAFPGGGTYIDFPTREAIVTVQSLYNRLIVFCERSTYEMVPSGDPSTPFIVQLINSELGAESTFSQIPFDKVVLGIGDSSINACSGTNVDRIDAKIPDKVFSLKNTQGSLNQIVGIRDFYTEMAYWSVPSSSRLSTILFNDEVLVFNYKTGVWAINDDSITALGYYQAAASSVPTWGSTKKTWYEMATPWKGVATKENFKSVLAGNQQGFVSIIDADTSSNSESLYITNMISSANEVTITSYNHNLKDSSSGRETYIQLKSAAGDATIVAMNNNIYKISEVVDVNTFKIVATFNGSYSGGGTLSTVSSIEIVTKQYNFYLKQGFSFNINKVDLLMDKTSVGEFTVDYFSSSSDSRDGTAIVETAPYSLIHQESSQERVWRSFYPVTHGNCIQLRFYQSDLQLTNPAKALSDFTAHAILFYTSKCSYRLQ